MTWNIMLHDCLDMDDINCYFSFSFDCLKQQAVMQLHQNCNNATSMLPTNTNTCHWHNTTAASVQLKHNVASLHGDWWFQIIIPLFLYSPLPQHAVMRPLTAHKNATSTMPPNASAPCHNNTRSATETQRCIVAWRWLIWCQSTCFTVAQVDCCYSFLFFLHQDQCSVWSPMLCDAAIDGSFRTSLLLIWREFGSKHITVFPGCWLVLNKPKFASTLSYVSSVLMPALPLSPHCALVACLVLVLTWRPLGIAC